MVLERNIGTAKRASRFMRQGKTGISEARKILKTGLLQESDDDTTTQGVTTTTVAPNMLKRRAATLNAKPA